MCKRPTAFSGLQDGTLTTDEMLTSLCLDAAVSDEAVDEQVRPVHLMVEIKCLHLDASDPSPDP